MGVIVLLILVSLAVALLFLGLFIWSVNKGQFDDDFSPSVTMLNDSTINKGQNEQH
jgi:cbb3-type cytochrome oxidase maturation protein